MRYADGTVRQIGYDQDGVPNHFVDTDGSTWTRQAGGNRWESEGGESFFGTIEVVPAGSFDNVAGSISLRIYEGAFLVSERMFFPIGGVSVTFEDLFVTLTPQRLSMWRAFVTFS